MTDQVHNSMEAERQARLDAAAKFTEANARYFFLRECRAEGIDPAMGVSPALLKILGGNNGR
tara:strand:- start:867 stop:1052 length:186 start_codon:yes stop_codon:yes gene_type:complete